MPTSEDVNTGMGLVGPHARADGDRPVVEPDVERLAVRGYDFVGLVVVGTAARCLRQTALELAELVSGVVSDGAVLDGVTDDTLLPVPIAGDGVAAEVGRLHERGEGGELRRLLLGHGDPFGWDGRSSPVWSICDLT